MLPNEVTISAVFCDDATGEVVLEVNRPESIDANMVIEIAQATGWIAHTLRSPEKFCKGKESFLTITWEKSFQAAISSGK
jgi:predicted metal-dependent RNase